jgi:predicted RNA polymerase sigma factor
MTVAKRRAIDTFRRTELADRTSAAIAADLPVGFTPDFDARLDDTVDDDLLRLMFICCHPVLPEQGRVALTLRLLGGLTTREIARSFLTSEATIAQRISRAKRTIAEAAVPFEEPDRAQRAERLTAVLGVVYLIFNEGYAATAGADWMRPALCDEAMRLGRSLAAVAPDAAEAHALVALMELQASRTAARTDRDGTPVLLLDQDRRRWDRLLIRHGLAALDRAEALTAGRPPGNYQLQAGIAACHARAPVAADTDWLRICALYAELAVLSNSPVVELNRAVALGKAYGPAAGLALADQLTAFPQLAGYHLLPSVRGDLLAALDRPAEAEAEFRRAAALATNTREQLLLTARADACAVAAGRPPVR